MILQKIDQQISQARALTHVTVEPGIEQSTNARGVRVARQGNHSRGRRGKAHRLSELSHTDIHGICVDEKHLWRVNLSQGNRFQSTAGNPDQA